MNAKHCAAAILFREAADDLTALARKLDAAFVHLSNVERQAFYEIKGTDYLDEGVARDIRKFSASLMERERQAS